MANEEVRETGSQFAARLRTQQNMIELTRKEWLSLFMPGMRPNPYFSDRPDLSDIKYQPQALIKPKTLAAGTGTLNLLPKVDKYRAVVELGPVISDTTRAFSLLFQDEDATPMTGGIAGVVGVADLTAGIPSQVLRGMRFYGLPGKRADVVITGAGVEKINFDLIGWYEQFD